MQIHLSINEILTAVGTPPTICGGAATSAVLNGLAVNITDNNDNAIFTVSDMASCPYISPGTAQVGSIKDNLGDTRTTAAYYDAGTQTYIITLGFVEIYNYGWLKINIAKTGFNTYSNLIKVYGYDLGTGLNLVHNNHFSFSLTREHYTVTGVDYALQYSDFIFIRRPITNEIELYASCSNPCGSIAFYNEGIEISETISLADASTIDCYCSSLVSSCTKSYDIPNGINWMPVQETTITCNTECTEECINVLGYNDINVAVSVSQDSFVYVNGYLASVFENLRVLVELARYDGNIVYTNYIDLVMDYAAWQSANFNYLQTWTLPLTLEDGLHMLRTYIQLMNTYIANYVYSCYETVEFNTCNWYSIERTTCGTITITNRSDQSMIVTVSKVISETATELESTTTIAALSSGTITLDTGVYIVESVGWDAIVNTSTYVSYCDVITCGEAYLNKLICCNPGNNCDPCYDNNCNEREYYNFNAFSMLSFSILSSINDIYSIDSVFDYSDPSTTAKLYKLSTLIDTAAKYCQTCEEPCKDC